MADAEDFGAGRMLLVSYSSPEVMESILPSLVSIAEDDESVRESLPGFFSAGARLR